MNHTILAIKDAKSGLFLKPIYTPSVPVAIRTFADAVNDKNSFVNAHPEDYDLYLIGTWNDETGKTENTKNPELQVKAETLVKEK